MATITKNSVANTVYGRVTDVARRPLANLNVTLFDVDMRDWQPLADTLTDREGRYELRWSHSQLSGRGRKTADIAVTVSTQERRTELYRSTMDEVRFNAGRREEINITITGAVPAETVEFDALVAEITFLAKNVAIAELQESKTHRDVTFLSKELLVPAQKIIHVIVAQRLHQLSEGDAAFFYALLCKDTLLYNDWSGRMNARLSIDLDSDVNTLLYDAALVDETRVTADVNQAVVDSIIAPSVGKALKANLAILARHREKANRYYRDENPRKVIELLASVCRPEKLAEVQQLFREHKDNLNGFLEKVTDASFFDSKAKQRDAKTAVALGKLYGFGNEMLSRVVKAKKIKKPEDLRKLARLNKADWEATLAQVNPELTDKQLIGTYASAMVRKLEKEFPTVAFAAQLEREEKAVLRNQDKIVSFLNRHDDFDLTKDRIDLYFKKKRIAKKDSEAIGDELKSVQRVFKLIPHYRKTRALRDAHIHSAQHIVSIGEMRFVQEVAPAAGLSDSEAKAVYRKAETQHTAAMLLVGELQGTMGTLDIAAFETNSLALKLEAVSTDFPNLKSLFKGIDTCACEHCRSVYSPAAYLVELLQFLDKRSVVAGNAKSVLFNRRPDLGDIDLSCANANTPVKYVDLVCELLEAVVAPDAGIDYSGNLSDGPDPLKGKISSALLTALQAVGWPVTADALIHETESDSLSPATLPHYLRDTKVVCKIVNNGGLDYTIHRLRQTLLPAAELDAAPEYVNGKAYEILRESAFAFRLPFDLNHVEAKGYFNRFDIHRANLMQAFQVAGMPDDAAIAAERLGLSDAERKIIVEGPNPNDNAAQQAYWNVPAPGNVVDGLKQVDRFLDRAGLSFTELDLLLKLGFIDQNNNLFIRHNDLSCDTAQKEIANLDLAALDRIHRFLRLQKKTGWSYTLLDAIIMQTKLGNGTLDDDCLIKAAQLSLVEAKTGISLEQLVGCFGEIPHTVYQEGGPKPLYHQVFLNKAKNGMVDERLQPEGVNGSATLAATMEYLATCMQLKTKDLEALLPLLPDHNLTFANLSILFAASRLASKLKLKPVDFAIAIRLSVNNFTASPADMLQFIATAEALREAPLALTDAAFLLAHEATNLADRVMGDAKIEALLGELQGQYEQINTALASTFDPNLLAIEQQESLRSALSGFVSLTEADVQAIVGFLGRDWASATDAKQFVADRFDARIDRTSIDAAIDALDAATGPDTEAEQNDLVKALLDAISMFRVHAAKRAHLAALVAASFKSEAELVGAVLTHAVLKQAAPGTESVGALLTDDLDQAVNEANYPKQYGALRLLHKLVVIIKAFELSGEEVAWYLQNNADLGWLELDGLPFETGHTAADLAAYLSFVRAVGLGKTSTPVADPADAERSITFFDTMALSLRPATTKDELMRAIALLTGYEKDELAAIDAHLFAVFDRANYHHTHTWERLIECAELMRKLGATMAQVVNYVKPTLVLSDISDLRATLKSRYDESTWLSTLKEIMDTVRPQKRDALVAYLLATQTEAKDENDLYEYLLVDVEMGACMPSSRIVLAHNSVQLFVHRCLMGLEPDAIAEVEKDPNWGQWKWMKNYRVWEANRKVFLYPENWYDVTLADDKSYLLAEFIDELQQNELTNDTAEEALRGYLEKLDGIAFLEVMATWYDVPTRNMHVFARTKGGDPAIYYYRRFEKERYWTPWEKVELDISGDHLLAFVRNGRLHLAWPVFSEEPDPNPESTVPASTAGTVVQNDKPKRKLKIQLATSEYSNKRWQPKRVSKESIVTPSFYTAEDHYFQKEKYNLIYLEQGSQVIIFSSEWKEGDVHTRNGVFNIAGCKGYPELLFQGDDYFPDFFPDFKDSVLQSQRYNELTHISPDELAVSNGLSFFGFYELLNKTPGKFRISYPHQLTLIDLLSFLYQLLMSALLSNNAAAASYDHLRRYKIPLGTLLPYFMEDSNHAYVIIPGFYKKEDEKLVATSDPSFTDAEKRTVSDVFQLLDDVVNWVKEMAAAFQENPPVDSEEAINRIITDSGFQDLLKEIADYEALDFIINFLIGKTGNEAFDALLIQLRDARGLVYGEQFKNMYHPLVCSLRSTLYRDGIPGLMKRETQLQQTSFHFETYYSPNQSLVPHSWYKNPDGSATPSYPIEDLDFTSDGSYSLYNWDLFFRVPLHIAGSLTANQRFEEAMDWFHYLFNPTGALPGMGSQKFWVTKPFYLNQETDYVAQRIDTLLYGASDTSNPDIKELEFAISEWRTKPFRPDVVARFRPVAYQKALLMKYLDNLIEWGDYLFRQDTMESIAQATQLYVLADKLLGPKPRVVPPVVKPPYETYNQLEAKLDGFGNALVELENILPDLTVLPEGGAELPPVPITLSMHYFCIPHNERMGEYWDRVADRLFKIRHCQNIDGVERSLALFAPPIDPGMLVRATASGLDISAIIAGLNAPAPYYRFNVLSQKASELAQEVRGLGNALLQALEKKDAEALSLLRNELELSVLGSVTDLKRLQIDEAVEQIETLTLTKKVTEERQAYYANIEKIIPKEQLNLDKLAEANDYQLASQTVRTVAGALRLVPEFHVGASGFGGSPHVVMQLGGSAMSTATSIGADILNILSTVASYEANQASILGGYERRFDEWKLQERLAEKELASIANQIKAAEIRREIAETDLKNHELQIENAKKADEFMRSKYTNKELYDWMIGQISAVYFKSYQLAHDFAKKAERSYRFELGNDDSFISYGYWDSMKKGLQSADHLIHDIKRMETGYLDKNKREYEITKHVSLAQLDPLALVRLRTAGVCDFELPEVAYDLDHPGHYFRRLKSVSISIPCVAGPYTSVSAKLSLVKNAYRKGTAPDNLAGTGYAEDPGNDERFAYNIGAIQSIATSGAQNDSGIFELNFRDERYLPFEGTGAISAWRLELPTVVKKFDYQTITDIIVHVRYTAREGGTSLKTVANAALKDQLETMKQGLSQTGMHVAIGLRHGRPNEWQLLKQQGDANLVIGKSHLPYLAQSADLEIDSIMLLAKVMGNPANFTLAIDGTSINLARVDELQLCRCTTNDVELDTMFNLSVADADRAKLEELMLLVKYRF
ncbi:Tc toxin subunit A-related protein [Parapedobacter sp.]